MISQIAIVLFDGFAFGMLLFVLSVGLSVTLGLMNFINLAHCAFGMLGGYVAATSSRHSTRRGHRRHSTISPWSTSRAALWSVT